MSNSKASSFSSSSTSSSSSSHSKENNDSETLSPTISSGVSTLLHLLTFPFFLLYECLLRLTSLSLTGLLFLFKFFLLPFFTTTKTNERAEETLESKIKIEDYKKTDVEDAKDDDDDETQNKVAQTQDDETKNAQSNKSKRTRRRKGKKNTNTTTNTVSTSSEETQKPSLYLDSKSVSPSKPAVSSHPAPSLNRKERRKMDKIFSSSPSLDDDTKNNLMSLIKANAKSLQGSGFARRDKGSQMKMIEKLLGGLDN